MYDKNYHGDVENKQDLTTSNLSVGESYKGQTSGLDTYKRTPSNVNTNIEYTQTESSDNQESISQYWSPMKVAVHIDFSKIEIFPSAKTTSNDTCNNAHNLDHFLRNKHFNETIFKPAEISQQQPTLALQLSTFLRTVSSCTDMITSKNKSKLSQGQNRQIHPYPDQINKPDCQFKVDQTLNEGRLDSLKSKYQKVKSGIELSNSKIFKNYENQDEDEDKHFFYSPMPDIRSQFLDTEKKIMLQKTIKMTHFSSDSKNQQNSSSTHKDNNNSYTYKDLHSISNISANPFKDHIQLDTPSQDQDFFEKNLQEGKVSNQEKYLEGFGTTDKQKQLRESIGDTSLVPYDSYTRDKISSTLKKHFQSALAQESMSSQKKDRNWADANLDTETKINNICQDTSVTGSLFYNHDLKNQHFYSESNQVQNPASQFISVQERINQVKIDILEDEKIRKSTPENEPELQKSNYSYSKYLRCNNDIQQSNQIKLVDKAPITPFYSQGQTKNQKNSQEYNYDISEPKIKIILEKQNQNSFDKNNDIESKLIYGRSVISSNTLNSQNVQNYMDNFPYNRKNYEQATNQVQENYTIQRSEAQQSNQGFINHLEEFEDQSPIIKSNTNSDSRFYTQTIKNVTSRSNAQVNNRSPNIYISDYNISQNNLDGQKSSNIFQKGQQESSGSRGIPNQNSTTNMYKLVNSGTGDMQMRQNGSINFVDANAFENKHTGYISQQFVEHKPEFDTSPVRLPNPSRVRVNQNSISAVDSGTKRQQEYNKSKQIYRENNNCSMNLLNLNNSNFVKFNNSTNQISNRISIALKSSNKSEVSLQDERIQMNNQYTTQRENLLKLKTSLGVKSAVCETENQIGDETVRNQRNKNNQSFTHNSTMITRHNTNKKQRKMSLSSSLDHNILNTSLFVNKGRKSIQGEQQKFFGEDLVLKTKMTEKKHFNGNKGYLNHSLSRDRVYNRQSMQLGQGKYLKVNPSEEYGDFSQSFRIFK